MLYRLNNQKLILTMSYQPFITDEKLLEKLKEGFIKLCKLDYSSQVETIALAFILPIEMLGIIVRFMAAWVEAINKKLEKLKKGTNTFADWFSIRGFTYDEFRWVMETKISDEKIDRVLVYDFLYLDDAIAVEEFKIKYSNPELSMRENYLKALADISKVEIPVLYKFLCKTKFVFRYPIEAFIRHNYMLARSSSGKSEFIKHIIHQLILKLALNKTIILLEPHFDLSSELIMLRALWKRGKRSIIYLDPDITSTKALLCETNTLEEEYSFCINPFDIDTSKKKQIQFLVDHLSKAFFSLVVSDETHNMLSVIEACVETLLLKPNSDIRDLKRFMDDNLNADLVKFAQQNLDGERQEMMLNRFLQDKKIQPTKSSIYFRLQSILGKKSLLDCLVGKSTINLQECMNSGKIIICNFSKAAVGEDGAQMLGKLFTALISGYATLRQKQRKDDRTETFIFIDEFQNYINPGSTEKLFTEQRKYKTYCFVANQQLGQSMTPEIRRLVSGNTIQKFMSENDSDSIEWFSKQFRKLPPNPIEKLPNYSFWFNDSANKNLGSFILRSPSYLVDQNSKYYLNKNELHGAFMYLIQESGIYRKTSETKTTNSINQINPQKGYDALDGIFNHNFTE